MRRVFAGIAYSNHEIAEMFGKTFDAPSPDASPRLQWSMKDISVFSYCEHHMALMYDMNVNVAYVPRGRVIGSEQNCTNLRSWQSKRLQLQERLGQDIAEILMEAVGTPDVGVVITGSHSCMTARGIRNVSSRTTTKTFCGAFQTDHALQELLVRRIESYESIGSFQRRRRQYNLPGAWLWISTAQTRCWRCRYLTDKSIRKR